MKFKRFAIPFLAVFLFSSTLQAAAKPSPPPKESKVGRTVGLAAGAFAGFVIGFRASDDDAVNAGQKLARNVIIGSVLGGLGGFFLGRAIDKRSFQRSLDPSTARQIRDRLVDEETEKLKAILDSAP